MKRILSSLAIASLVGATTAQAAIPITRYDAYVVEIPHCYANQGAYWGIIGGVNQPYHSNYKNHIVSDDLNIVLSGTTLPGFTVDYHPGPFIGLTAGFRIYWARFEAELSYRYNKIDEIIGFFQLTGYDVVPNPNPPPATILIPATITTPNIPDVGGLHVGTLFGNFYFDVYYTSGWLWSIGVGVGGIGYYIDGSLTGFPVDFNYASMNIAGQIILGVSYTWSPCIETGITYRLMGAPNTHHEENGFYYPNWRVEISHPYVTNTLAFEIRFT